MILTELAVDVDAFETRTGWQIKPEGACRGDTCVPLPESVRLVDGRLDAKVLAARLDMPLVSDDATKTWALGPAVAGTDRALASAVAPELVLPDADGNPFKLSSLRGQKVLLVSWASW